MTNASEEIEDSTAPLIEHLKELRQRLIWSLVAFVIGMGKQDDKVIILVDIVKALSKENLSKVSSSRCCPETNQSDHKY